MKSEFLRTFFVEAGLRIIEGSGKAGSAMPEIRHELDEVEKSQRFASFRRETERAQKDTRKK
jgi:hypothetical protein